MQAIEDFDLAVSTLKDMGDDVKVPSDRIGGILRSMDCWVMYDGDTVVGVGALQIVENHTAPHVYVKREFRRSGYGKKIINELNEQAKNLGSSAMVGYTPDWNEAAKQMMLDSGYKYLRTESDLFITIKEFDNGS